MTPANLPRSTGGIATQFTGVVLALALVGTAFVFKTAGQWLSHANPHGDWTEETHPVDVDLAGRDFTIPANMIRHAPQRTATAPTDRVDLAVLWPDMKGYEQELAAGFMDASDNSPLILVSIETDSKSQGTSELLDNVYRTLAVGEPAKGPGGLSLLWLSDGKNGGTDFVAFEEGSAPRFAARCFTPTNAGLAATCQRDIRLGDDLMVSYRFRQSYLSSWSSLERKIGALVQSFQPH
ncbi:hypothetical protein H2509_10845 [Stappia sp. F7233]|uniref:Uncharacterized protein n=1 Tax=Stappia albiluteola TaxID=2758565 RepID=A0A839ACY7_9HYPH|nr:hypothetical protein [Stappia albiluteola]MBA5777620.1 hypothetical protein [Stappia albiluteola]